MEPVIRNAFLVGLAKEEARPARPGKSRIYPSEAGGCARKMMLRISGVKGEDFPLKAKEAMENGVVYEDSTYRILQRFYGAENVLPQLQLKTQYWSGKSDFVIFHGTDHPIIVEHKATGEKYWDYRYDPLPKKAHVIQLALYDKFYGDEFGIKPELRLYYRTWGHWAEFLLDVQRDVIHIEGYVDDKPRSLDVPVSMTSLMQSLEWFYKNNKIPKRLPEDKMEKNCTFNGKPSCPYYGCCWPKELSVEEALCAE